MLLSSLYIQSVEGKGRAVFTDRFIETGTILEVAPVLVLNESDTELIKKTDLYNYYFLWSEEKEISAIALGYGSIYNHSYHPNTRYETYYEEKVIHFIALKDINAGEEVTINYNHDPESQAELWFNNIL